MLDRRIMSKPAERKSTICIVGVGAVTAVGLTAPSAAAAVRAGIAGFGEHPFMIDRQGEPMIVAAVPNLENGFKRRRPVRSTRGARASARRCCRWRRIAVT
jgi:hypothetical protein